MAALAPAPKFYQTDEDGAPLALGKVYTYQAGSTTPLVTYTDASGGSQNTNPVTLGADGTADIWLSPSYLYKFVVKDATGSTIYTVDDIGGAVSVSDLSASSGSSLVGFIQGGTAPVAETVQTALRRVIYVEQFGAVGDGATDDLTALTNAINYVLANTEVELRFLAKTYAISSALPNINVNGVRLIGFGPSYGHDVGTLAQGTVIVKIGASSGTMLTIAPTEGASGQCLTGIALKGITFNCASKAAKGVVLKSIRYSDIDIAVFNATNTGFELNVATTLGEATSLLFNTIKFVGRQVDGSGASGVAMKLRGDANGNPCFNNIMADVVHYTSSGIIHENSDNNWWPECRVLRSAGGTATNSVEWLGAATEPISCRFEHYGVLSTTVAAIAKGTGTYAVAAKGITIDNLDTANSTPAPTEETGATILDGQWRAYTPTATATTGTITTVGATSGRYRREVKTVEVQAAVTITTNGTGGGKLRVTLPGPSSVANGPYYGTGRANVVSGKQVLAAFINAQTYMDIQNYDDTYPMANSEQVIVSGRYEVGT